MAAIEQKLEAQATVATNWLADGNAFWYRRNNDTDKFTFFFVDAVNKTRGPAFDHAKLASELQNLTQIDIDPEALPFPSIDIQPDASYVQFRFAAKKWQFGPDNVLQRIQDDDAEHDERILEKEVPSGHSSKTITVSFVNRSAGLLELFWIDWDGNATSYMEIASGETGKQRTYQGHVWRIVDEASGKTRAIYRAPEQVSDVFIIEPDERVLEKEVPSGHSSKAITVSFVNQSASLVELFWIDWDGKATSYMEIASGETGKQETYQGHVWRIVDKASGATKVVYRAPEQVSDVFFIEDKETKPSEETRANAAPEVKAGDDADVKTLVVGGEHDDDDTGSPPSADESSSRRQLFIADYNLWLTERDGTKVQISTNGSKDNAFGEELHLSPDEMFAVAWQSTSKQDHPVNLVDSSPKDQVEPKLKTIQYLKPGDRIQEDTPRIFDLNARSEVQVDNSLFAKPWKVYDLGWSKNGEEYRFIFNERGHQHLRILSLRRDGQVRVLVEESSDTFIDYSSKLYWSLVEDTDELIWASERSGYNHLYLIDLQEGTVKNQITDGSWNVYSIEHVDEANRKLWLQVIGVTEGKDLYYLFPAHVNFDGTDFHVLSDGDGTHTCSWSPERRYLIDTYSCVDFPPQTHLRDGQTGDRIMVLEDTSLEPLQNEGWVAPERFVAPGRDGTTPIYGIIVRPADFNESKSYPILEDIYAGPHSFFTPKAFAETASLRDWANEGYIVVKLDGMGTNWRSKAFHDVCHKNLKDGGLPDRIAWITAAASTRPWMDTSRVGIFGGSAGGQNAAAAVLHHGDFYKAAAADCGCHDNRMDKIWWNEQWMGYPIDESYTESSNVTHAGKLNGALMLIVGELDDNVDPSSTMQLVHALNENDKDYEFVFFPGAGHGCGGSKYGLRRQRAFFKKHLQP